MGDAADDAFDAWLRAEDRFYSEHKPASFQKGSGNYTWRQADGTLINMNDMTNDHISNAIRKCIQYGNTGKQAQLEEILRDRLTND